MASGQPKTEKSKAKYDAFIREYHINGNNAAQAAIFAGYAEKSARQTGQKLLTNTYIQEGLKKLQQEAIKEHGITLEQRLSWLEDVVNAGFKEMKGFKGQSKKNQDLKAVISAITEMNKMLGTTVEEEDVSNQPISRVQIEVISASA